MTALPLRLARAARLAAAALAAALLLAAHPALAAKKTLPPGARIDLNRASVAELMRLPGVGEKRAQAIVAHRSRQPFRRAEDVVAAGGPSGIAPSPAPSSGRNVARPSWRSRRSPSTAASC